MRIKSSIWNRNWTNMKKIKMPMTFNNKKYKKHSIWTKIFIMEIKFLTLTKIHKRMTNVYKKNIQKQMSHFLGVKKKIYLINFLEIFLRQIYNKGLKIDI